MATVRQLDATRGARRALPFAPACRPAPRVGAPGGGRSAGERGLATLTQRGPRESPLMLAVAGFPGVILEHDRPAAIRQPTEIELGRIGLAYLRGERAAGAPPHEHVVAVVEMLRQLEQVRARFAGAELTGPVSLSLQLVDEQERPLAYTPALREALAQQLVLRATWLHDQISVHLGGALICLDEPFLDALASPFAPLDEADGLALLAQTLDDLPTPCGLCVAGLPNWEAILSLPVDVVYFDAYGHRPGLLQSASAVVDYLARGGILAWGLVPTDAAALANERAEALAHRFESAVAYLAADGGIEPAQIRAAALISTSGSLAHLPLDLAAHAAALCGELAAHLRALYQLDQ